MLQFFFRLIGYALLLGIASRIAQTLWTANGLDQFASVQSLHDDGLIVVAIAPLVLALAGFGALRDLCVFVGCALAAAAITAPFVIARVAGA
jgi:hypothetical protein